MKKIFFLNLVFSLLLLCFGQVFAQETNKKLASAQIKDMSGNIINTNDFDNEGKPIVISFWATWCKPCLEELNTISDLYEDWREETGVKIIAVSIDDSRNSKRVAPFVKSKQWEYEVYLDENSDFKRAMGVTNPPHTYVLDANKNIVYEHNGYAPGDENNLLKEIKKTLENKEEK